MNLTDMQTERPCMMWRIVLFAIMNLRRIENLGGANTALSAGNESDGMADDDCLYKQ